MDKCVPVLTQIQHLFISCTLCYVLPTFAPKEKIIYLSSEHLSKMSPFPRYYSHLPLSSFSYNKRKGEKIILQYVMTLYVARGEQILLFLLAHINRKICPLEQSGYFIGLYSITHVYILYTKCYCLDPFQKPKNTQHMCFREAPSEK